MIKNLIILFLAINLSVSYSQIPLLIEGTVVNNSISGNWNGVNIPRSVSTKLTYRNNSITSLNTSGYMLQAGDETPGATNNNLDGEVITGNKFVWNGANGSSVITHGLFAGYNINSVVKYNSLDKVPYGIIFKSGTDAGVNMTFTSGGCSYNICKNGKFAGRVKGINGIKFYNNTFYSGDGGGWYLLLISANMDRAVPSPSIGTKVFNNIFYSTIQIPMIKIESGCLTNFESDYNVYWCSAGEPTFNIDGVTHTWAQWRAHGYDAHSIIINPNFINTIDFVPATRLDYGTNLGADWQTGLSTTAAWIAGSSPSTTDQNGTWQVGAHVYSTQVVHVTSISVTGAGGSTTITTDNGTLQLSTAVLPANATNKTVTWSIINGTGQATINATGLVTAVGNGTVTARATANDGSSVYGTLIITNSNQIIPVTGITVDGAGGVTTINTNNGTLQLSAAILPANATDKTVTWSIVNGTGQATINATGLVTAVDNGTVTARATANDGSDVYGTLIITNSNQLVPVTGITVKGAGGSTTITTDNGTLQLSAAILPANATNKTISWSIANGTGQATINSTGLVTAVDNGTVTARATANDGSGVYGTLIITSSNQMVPVTSVTVTGNGGATTITIDNGTLQLNAEVLPANSNKTVTWSISNGTGQSTINASGLVTAVDNGTVTARATANDGSGVYGTLIITNSNQLVPVTGITVSGAGGATTITSDNGTLQLSAAVLPVNATDKTVIWSLVNGTGQATINASGLVTAVDNGTVTARATANDGSGVYGTLIITNSISVSGITVTGEGGSTTISTNNGSLQLSALILPANAIDKTVTWSLVNGTGQATINATGLVTAVDNGTVTARATANDGSGVYGTLIITNSNQVVPLTWITVAGEGGSTSITTPNGTLQLSAIVLPVNATDKTVSWSIINGTGQATINSTGLVTAVDNGTVTARATANDGSGVYGILIITNSISVSGITVTGEGGSTTITTNNGTLQLSAEVLPANAIIKTVTWSIVNGTGQATINATGLVTAVDNGTVTARATANDGSSVYGTLILTISNQIIPVTGITVAGAGGVSTITTNNGTLQLSAEVLPAIATDKTVTWSIVNGTGQATINATGLVTAVDNGTVTARATANDGSDVYGTLIITNSSQVISVISIAVSGAGGSTNITADNGTLQLSAAILPANATNKTVSWSIANDTGQATINASGLVTAVDNGTVTARATANDGSGVYGTLIITNSNQIVPVTSITVTGAGGTTIITTDNGTLQLSASVLGANATNKTVSWSVINGTGQATINTTGLVTAVDNGTITASAIANDGSGVYGTLIITNSNQVVPVTGINVTGAAGSNTITTNNGTLQLNAAVLPENATDKSVSWSIVNSTGQASINSSGLVTAVDNGTVTARATANDGSGVYGTLVITNSNQIVLVTSISVTGAGGATTITDDDGTLELNASVLPLNATDKSVIWSLVNGTGQATINSTGLVTAVDNGTVTVWAIAHDGSGNYTTLELTLSGQLIPVTDIIVAGEGGSTTINADNGSLQLSAEVSPPNATDTTVTWSIVNGWELATINESGLVKALNNGTVTASATANDASGVYGTMDISVEIDRPKPLSVIVTDYEIKIVFYEDFVSWTAGLYNFQGSLVMSKIVDSDTVVFDTFLISSGLYLIVLSKGEQVMVEKVINP